jgi:ribonuclease P protein component
LLKNDLPYNRICFTLSKGFTGAVARNRAKRLGREAYRLMRHRLCGGYDVILLVNPESEAALSDRMSQMETLFTKAGLIK